MDKEQSFCGVSDILQYDPISVWAHLNAILKKIREEHPDVDTLHFFKRQSDISIWSFTCLEQKYLSKGSRRLTGILIQLATKRYPRRNWCLIETTSRPVHHKTWKFISWPQSMEIYYEFTTKQVEEVNHRQANCVCYETFCNSHEFFYLKLSIGSEKTKQSCSDESKQRSTQDTNM